MAMCGKLSYGQLFIWPQAGFGLPFVRLLPAVRQSGVVGIYWDGLGRGSCNAVSMSQWPASDQWRRALAVGVGERDVHLIPQPLHHQSSPPLCDKPRSADLFTAIRINSTLSVSL